MKELHHIADDILREVSVNSADAARLVLESIEQMGVMSNSLSLIDLIGLMCRMISAGAETIRQNERTVSLAEAALASLEARADLQPSFKRDLRHFVKRILRVSGARDMALSLTTVEQCKHILDAAFGSSRSSYVKE